VITAILVAAAMFIPSPPGRGWREAPGEGRAAASKILTPSKPESRAADTKTVTLDVKDEDAHAILTSMQKQCGIKNLLIDRDVDARGTFVFKSVPCSTAFKVVFQSLGLGATNYGNSVITVGKPKR
jgi:hypothetical protein